MHTLHLACFWQHCFVANCVFQTHISMNYKVWGEMQDPSRCQLVNKINKVSCFMQYLK